MKFIKNINDEYTILKKIGSGNFGLVQLATHKTTQMKVAVKSVDKKKIASENPANVKLLENEIKTL